MGVEITSSFAILGIDEQFVDSANDHVGSDHVALLEAAIHNIESYDAARGGDAVYGAAQRLHRVAAGWLDRGSPPAAIRDSVQSQMGVGMGVSM